MSVFLRLREFWEHRTFNAETNHRIDLKTDYCGAPLAL